MSRHPKTPLAVPTADLIVRLGEIVGPEHAIVDPDLQKPFLTEWRDLYVGRTPLVLRPGSTPEVASILELASEARVAIVPQGGNTGLVGGQIPFETGTEIVLSLTRLNEIRGIDAASASMTVEAGVKLAQARAAAADAGRLFPLALASEGSCTIGGNLATNAGGVAALAYGTARDLALGLEVVLSDGRVWNGLRALKKDNTGYDLRDLFIGSEGTLGVITAATLKLFPEPRERATAFAAVPDLPSLLALFRLLEERAGSELTGFEFLSARTLEFVVRHAEGARLPLGDAAPWYALIELSSMEDGHANRIAEEALSLAIEHKVANDIAVAASGSQARDFWRLRDAASESQKPEGGSIKHDISVPVASIPDFLIRASEVVQKICPGARPAPFGHFGDGNIHYNVSQPVGMERERFLALWEPMSRAVHELVTEYSGSISAEHGIGRLKRNELPLVKSKVELDLMRSIKAALDPHGILNPGKVLRV
jgi:FAD/FMN-containing dehydrogenase